MTVQLNVVHQLLSSGYYVNDLISGNVGDVETIFSQMRRGRKQKLGQM